MESPEAARPGIASLQDRGELLEYSRVRATGDGGKYTFHPIDVSEAHAFAAIGGELHLRAPDGSPIDLRYERHVEHPSGDWSWIGRDANGVDAILTFGQHAMFGVLATSGGEELRMTTNAGQIWMVQQDPGKESRLEKDMREGRIGPDYRVPGEVGAEAFAPGVLEDGKALAKAASGAVPTASGDPTIDLLLGYTPGFVSMMGGASQAQTRLNHIVTVGNQVLVNSDVAASFRLLGTLQVNYSDSGSNETALDQLTGSTGSSPVTVPAALRPLREERDRLGADLVSLVRRFNDAEHEGCGLAWLIGGGQAQIVPGHEAFGYSVISDSNGTLSPDGGHYCHDETLVHEIGHNLGSAHDRDTAMGDDDVLDSDEYGRYPYSFGYKTSAANGNFYTVMAYGDVGQTAYRVFSNPQLTTCGGRACGVANQADNARSLRATIPLIAEFRSANETVSSSRRVWRSGDFDRDGLADLLWRNSSTGQNQVWPRARTTGYLTLGVVRGQAWKIVATGDFDGDGREDIVWRDTSTGTNTIWLSGNSSTRMTVQRVASQDWQIAGADDFDGDGKTDLLWRNFRTGQNQIWPRARTTGYLTLGTVPDQDWIVAGTGDFDGDGQADIMWRHASTGDNTIWRSGYHGSRITVQRVAGQDWQVAGIDDFDRDGRADLVWRNYRTGQNQLWPRARTTGYLNLATVSDHAWIVATTGDFDGDGRADIVWRHTSTGDNTIWLSGNSATRMTVQRVVSQNWQMVP